MTERSVSLVLVLVTAALLSMIFTPSSHNEGGAARSERLALDLNAMPPSAAGMPSSSASQEPLSGERKDGYIGGTKSTGRVAGIYLKVAQGVFLSIDRAPETLRKTAERWVDVEFPDVLANGSVAARAFISEAQAGIRTGDIVEVKFAHKASGDTARYFPVKEITRVTELVAKRDEMLARDYEQRIFARNARGSVRESPLAGAAPPAARPAWLSQAGGGTLAADRSGATQAPANSPK